jgi:hypothetical protein
MVTNNRGINLYFHVFRMFMILFVYVLYSGFCLTLDLESTQILGSKDQFRIQLVPQKGMGPYKISYSSLPKNWVATERYLLVKK